MEATISLKDYLEKDKDFVVPSYQRGYVWGKSRSDGQDSVTYILNTILRKFELDADIFMQGITVTEDKDEIILIDGQQRTTFFYILLHSLGYDGMCDFRLRYEVRKESEDFLKNIGDNIEVGDFQDVAFFKKTIGTINKWLESFDDKKRKALLDFVLHKIRFLYIDIPKVQARKVFAMMNGSRAQMLNQEVVKAELLRLVSLQDSEKKEPEWELNMLRSRYAREWDRWLHWWKRPDVQTVFNTSSQMGHLFAAIACLDKNGNPSFDKFVEEILGKKRNRQGALEAFDKLRRVQKRFEDVFADPIRHNYVGAVMRIFSESNARKFLEYYFGSDNKGIDLKRYYLCAFIGMNHDKIVQGTAHDLRDRFLEEYDLLSSPNVYDNNIQKEAAFHLLLRLNIDEDNLQNDGKGRRFDFSVWEGGQRSLEHIKAKSTVYHKEDNRYVRGDGVVITAEEAADLYPRERMGTIEDPLNPDRTIEVTEHCIGNLVLLYKGENSAFGNGNFEAKKKMFLTGRYQKDGKWETFRSRHLMHSIYKFASSQWEGSEIKENFKQTLEELKATYEPYMPLENEQD